MVFNFIIRVLSPIPIYLDINLLPLDQLPVQKILSFTQPPTPVAVAYLSAICRVEGTQPDEHFFSILQTKSAADLRQCINQCQLGKPTRPFSIVREGTARNNWEGVLDKRACLPQWAIPPRDESQHKALFRFLDKHTDNISYLDSRLILRVDTVSKFPASDRSRTVERCCLLLCDIGLVELNVGRR